MAGYIRPKYVSFTLFIKKIIRVIELQVLIKEFFQCFRFIIGGQSVECEEAPSCGGRVRAVHGPSCQIVARNVFFRKGFF